MSRNIGIRFLKIAVWIAILRFASWQAMPQSATGYGIADLTATEDFTLKGNVHPWAKPEYDLGPASAERKLNRMLLLLRPSGQQQQELDALAAAQQAPDSDQFHQWLSPQEFGRRFGLTDRDLARVTEWLNRCGFAIDEVAPSRLLVQFSGTAGQVSKCFHADLHRFALPSSAGNEPYAAVEHLANAQDPRIPAALSGLVRGVVSLHDFRRSGQALEDRLPDGVGYTRADSHSLTPAEFAMIYDLPPLYSAGVSGAGVTVAIVSRGNIDAADVAAFRQHARLQPQALKVSLVGAISEPAAGGGAEASLGVEWSAAVAPAAQANLVVAASTETTDGVDLAAQYAVNHLSGEVMSMGFATCETDMGSSELAFYDSLWQQAAVEGITTLVASGNNGAAGCERDSARPSVNGLCTSPFATCVGGTEFGPESSAGRPWLQPRNESGQWTAAQNPPSEQVWNERRFATGPSSGGGVSAVYAQPQWQMDLDGSSQTAGMRGVPDLSLLASGEDGRLIYRDSSWRISYGTAASAASFAGMMALAVEANGAPLGNINPSLYRLAKAEASPFRPATEGDNSIAGVAGYAATGAAYNLATGLGSVDGARLVEALIRRARSGSFEPEAPTEETFAPGAAIISVADFGADPSGKTDSTPAFQAAFDQATSTVKIPPGVYLLGCANPLYLSKSNIAYEGAGEGRTILRSCQGHTVKIASWRCAPASGASCTQGKGPFTLTITTAKPLLAGIDNFYCPQIDSTEVCSLDTWHGESPGFITLGEQFTLNGPAFPATLSNTLSNPHFPCGGGCGASPAAQDTFTVQSTIAPAANSGVGGRFSLPQNMVQAYDPRIGSKQTASSFSHITFDGGCNQCRSVSFETALVDMGNPRSAARGITSNSFRYVTFSNYAAVAVREDLTQGDTFTHITFRNAGQNGIIGDSPSDLTIANVSATNFGWQTDPRVVGTGVIYSSTFNFGCTSGGQGMSIRNVAVQPSKKSSFVGFGIWCGRSTAQTATASAYSGVSIANFKIQSDGNTLLPVSAFADRMTIHGFRIEGPPDPTVASSPYMEVAGSDLNLYGNSNLGFFFAPIDEGGQVDGGTPLHTHYARISIHDNKIDCVAPLRQNTGCFGIAIGGFQNSVGDVVPSYIDSVNIYNNKATYTFGSVNQGNVVHISLGSNEGGNGMPVGVLTNVHVFNESVTIAGTQTMGGGWSAFATLAGDNKANANWKFDHDTVKWTKTTTAHCLDHLRATPGAIAYDVDVQSEVTPANPLLTDRSGGTFPGITVLR